MNNNKLSLSDNQKSALNLKKDIERACIKRGLNLAVHDGKIGFVDQEEMKIVMLWNPEYKIGGKS